jgi:hypothetical protein
MGNIGGIQKLSHIWWVLWHVALLATNENIPKDWGKTTKDGSMNGDVPGRARFV